MGSRRFPGAELGKNSFLTLTERKQRQETFYKPLFGPKTPSLSLTLKNSPLRDKGGFYGKMYPFFTIFFAKMLYFSTGMHSV